MLELVLALPLLMLMVALIINYGTVASWKVRGLAVARHAVWSARWPRSSSNLPRPDYWPSSASMSAGGIGDLAVLDDPRVNHPVVRGPMPNGFGVRDWLLDPSRGLAEGRSDLTRQFPLLTSASPYHLSSANRLLWRFWDHKEMGLYTSWERRVPVIYDLPKAPPALSDAYRQAALAILYAPFRPALAPLDRDDEFIGYSNRFGWQMGAPDFHPVLERFCSVDHSEAQKWVDKLIDDIEGWIDTSSGVPQRVGGVPQRMTEAFIWLYTRVINELQNELVPGIPPNQAAAINAEIKMLQERIELLQEYLNELRNAVD